MKGTKFFGIGIALTACVLALLLVLEAGFVSVAWAGKPPRTSTTKPGYAMFRDGAQDVIKSDGGGAYVDCTLGGEDLVQINVWDADGSLRWVRFFPGKLYYTFEWCSSETPSTRRIKFCFDVSKISTRTGNAVHDILRWYKDGADYRERSTTTPGFIDDNSLHAPIMVNIVAYRSIGDDHVQFAVDPLGDVLNPGADPRAITQTSVDGYYPDDTNVDYLDTWELPSPQYEPAPYIIYFLDYGNNGFVVEPVAWDQGKPVTWIIKTAKRKPNNPVRLCVKIGDPSGPNVYLAEYPNGVPFELTVSLNPLISGAPSKDSTLSATWGEIKAK
jgi:hypothetical protein